MTDGVHDEYAECKHQDEQQARYDAARSDMPVRYHSEPPAIDDTEADGHLHRWTRPPAAPTAPAAPSAEQILAERFARGEIDEEEYQRRLATLRTPDRLTKH